MSRSFRRLIAQLALLTFAGVIGLSGFDGHSGFDDDRACGDRGLYVSRDAAILAPATPVAAAGHCALCHLQRAASGASPATPVVLHSDLLPSPAPAFEVLAHVRGCLAHRSPSRAPPAPLA